jgi:hypothetical protein
MAASTYGYDEKSTVRSAKLAGVEETKATVIYCDEV